MYIFPNYICAVNDLLRCLSHRDEQVFLKIFGFLNLLQLLSLHHCVMECLPWTRESKMTFGSGSQTYKFPGLPLTPTVYQTDPNGSVWFHL